jgi:hypothetical protein
MAQSSVQAGVPKKDYVKLVDGFLACTVSKAGDVVCLTDAQAKYAALRLG